MKSLNKNNAGNGQSFEDEMKICKLRYEIKNSLKNQGFFIEKNKIFLPDNIDKNYIRGLHKTAIKHKKSLAEKHLKKKEEELLLRIASGQDIEVENIRPHLIEVKRGSEEELLFRYASLNWSIPVSSGYGRRLRFIVVDEYNNKLIGLIGLGDPVFSQKARDSWVGWNMESRKERLHHVMDAFVLGAVPPYSHLLFGKFIALLVASNEVREAFKNKYKNKKSYISQRELDGQLALITTTSALGKSSIYQRLKINNKIIFQSCGFTRGSGEFHFANGTYTKISDFVKENCIATAKQKSWGTGFRNRREVIRKGLQAMGISTNWSYHGIEREVFAVPLAENTKAFLSGKTAQIQAYDLSVEKLFEFFKDRWLIRRSHTNRKWQEFLREDFRIWSIDENER